ncbi:hypothetical protein ACFQ61_09745 [Streptomyces sp. NPDC056500]|uniref:hypothetical protein n=1 Tax=Streptomyces sp. NPDC056500 TaxID=3345840 RepID=UPI0036AB5721
MQAQHDPVVHLDGDEVQRRRETSEADQSGTGVTADEQNSPRAVGSHGTATTGRRPDIARDLLRRRDLAVTGWTTPAAAITEVQRAAMRETDQANTVVLRRILTDHGWPGITLAGADAAQAAWQIALHADDVDFQKHALELLADGVTHGEALPAHWAHLYDWCCVLARRPSVVRHAVPLRPRRCRAVPRRRARHAR